MPHDRHLPGDLHRTAGGSCSRWRRLELGRLGGGTTLEGCLKGGGPVRCPCRREHRLRGGDPGRRSEEVEILEIIDPDLVVVTASFKD
jgi:hypothetical protein